MAKKKEVPMVGCRVDWVNGLMDHPSFTDELGTRLSLIGEGPFRVKRVSGMKMGNVVALTTPRGKVFGGIPPELLQKSEVIAVSASAV